MQDCLPSFKSRDSGSGAGLLKWAPVSLNVLFESLLKEGIIHPLLLDGETANIQTKCMNAHIYVTKWISFQSPRDKASLMKSRLTHY